MYPIEKYKFYVDEANRKVIAVSSYAGKKVRGVAQAHENDEFNFEIGKQIAAARCAAKISERRFRRATHKVDEAIRQYDLAKKYLEDMREYEHNAQIEYNETHFNEENILSSF